MCGRDTGHLFKSHGAMGVWCARGKSTVGGLVILSTLRDRDWLTNILVNDHSAVRRSDTCPTEITARAWRVSVCHRLGGKRYNVIRRWLGCGRRGGCSL